MPANTVSIRPTLPRDEAAWRALWDGYCRFYQAAISPEVTTHTWQRILDPRAPVFGIVAEDAAGRVIGMANYIIHENTWEIEPVCYLEDLFVDPAARAQGVGRQMIDWLVAAMQVQGWSRLYWMTREDNYRARGLYDKYNQRDAFVRYVLKAGK